MHLLLQLGAGLLFAVEGYSAGNIQCDNGDCYNINKEKNSAFNMVIWIVGAVFVLVIVTLLCTTKSKKTPKASPRREAIQPTITDEKYTQYRELEKVVLNNLELVNIVGEHSPFALNDGLSRSLVLIFESNKSILPLLHRLIDTDIQDASVRFEQENTLLRKNSFCSKVLSYYNRTSSLQYLRRILHPVLSDIVRDNVYCEIDTSKVPQGTEVEPSQKYLLDKCNIILSSILGSINDAPVNLRNLSYYLKRQVVEHLPKYSSVLNNYNNFDTATSIDVIEEVEEKSAESSSSSASSSSPSSSLDKKKGPQQDDTKRESVASNSNNNTNVPSKQSDNGEKQQQDKETSSSDSSSSESDKKENINHDSSIPHSVESTPGTPKSTNKKKTTGRKRRKSSCFGIDDDEEDKEENNQVFYNAIGSMLFLRLYCPAISVPSETSLVNERPKDNAKRTLTLIAKILQNLANGVRFGRKEPFMTVMNPFISDNLENIKRFFDDIAANEVTELKDSAKNTEVPADVRESAMKVIFASIVAIEDKLQKEKYYDSLCRIMDAIGRDVASSPAINAAKRKVQEYNLYQ
jgi:hypothetical protein